MRDDNNKEKKQINEAGIIVSHSIENCSLERTQTNKEDWITKKNKRKDH